jgi:hypothetical protein
MLVRLQEAPLPERAIVPNQWCVFTLWENNPLEVGREFVQVVRVIAPDGSLFLENEMPFRIVSADDIQIRLRLQIQSMPVWQEGKVEVKVFLKESENEVGSTCFKIRYLPKQDNAKASESTIS